MTEGYGTTIRVILEMPILSGLRTEGITDDDRASAAAAAVSMLRHHSPRVHDVNEFTLTSVGVAAECPRCEEAHRVKPFRGKAAAMIHAAARGEPYARMPLGDDQDAREADTILAALRYWQSAITEGRARFATAEMEIATEHGPALDTAEIDALCERLNMGGN